ncbi:glycine--tRNA ligase subunit beta [Natronospira bacteriovora]|uniref:Glycine--tRNA ligase beta subunit n=1 Tax=Natronospira bacteriovora TaxID=3069753 RepID=A0ABU0W6Y9_9GAMM|nr:glycine--tRNA ligase subunit beta [Natronospira sp. AB-CW4]MDQ2069798.1 glycine--tRNA ligase subunit beta [Natronospira sp. AB-CW4]
MAKQNAADAKTHTLLIEVGSEELPPSEAADLARSFARGLADALADNGLLAVDADPGAVEWFVSPRRMAARLAGVRERQADRDEEKLGPAVDKAFDAEGKPTKAAEGFARSCGVTVEELAHKETDKGSRLAYQRVIRGEPAEHIVPALADEVLRRLPAKRRMRWGDGDVEFARPVHWVVCLLDDKYLPGQILGLETGRHSRGHRFHRPQAVDIPSASAYEETLAGYKVFLDDADGHLRSHIRQSVSDLAAQLDGQAELNEALIAEVAALVEWPVPLSGRYEERFLALPDEVIVATLEGHQRYFALRDSGGRLKPGFITVANIESKDPETVQTGNERVISPRLDDAMFFWNTDRQKTLASRLDELDQVLFQKKLGSLGDKRRRVETLAAEVARIIDADVKASQRAATLARCDLLTEMVGEFPELQGIMGGHYARVDGEDEKVAVAIGDQYRPAQAGDELPRSPEGLALAIADRLDTLVGSFAAGQKPSGNKDPFALRRAALGLMRMIVEKALPLDLDELITAAGRNLPEGLSLDADGHAEIFEFLMERLRAWYREQGVRPEVFEAVAAIRPAQPADFHRRLKAVQAFLGLEASESLSAANKRIGNLLRKAEEDGETVSTADAAKLSEPAEKALAEALDKAGRAAASESDYSRRLEILAELREPVDRFFDEVLVMAEDADLKRARLGLLAELRAAFTTVADISRLQTG